jgi:cytoskeleton protein RodZ
MTDVRPPTGPVHPPSADAAQAGALLRAARQQQGLHIAALAAAIKVTPAKLEALESGRLDALPDATFARALAKTVCRQLKTDPAPVLALLPGAAIGGLERVDSGLNTPFRERSSRDDPAAWLPWRHPVLWIVVLLLAAAAAFVLVPSQSGLLPAASKGDAAPLPVMPPSGAGGPAAAADTLPSTTTTTMPVAAIGAAAAASDAALVPVAATETIGAAAGGAPASAVQAAAAIAASTADATLVLRAVQATWVQAVDGSGQTLMSRLVSAGETVALSPVLPVRLRIGNVKGTELQFRGQPVNLGTSRDNVANLTLP